VDEAGNALADAIAVNTGEWTEAADLAAGEREAEILALFGELAGKLDDLGTARRTAEWLECFDRQEAHLGRVQRFMGGTVRIELKRLHGPMQRRKGWRRSRQVKEQFRQKAAA
jgi:hypothetical protein